MADLFQHRFVLLEELAYPYALYRPADVPPPLPLILFLHGRGERGSDGVAQTRVGIGPIIALHPSWFRCLVALPQCPADRRWTESLELVDATWNALAAEGEVDEERVIVSGISMGGFGAWAYAARQRERLAALVPICGGGLVERAEALADLPIWAFHGAQDNVVAVERSREMVEAVRRAGGEPRYTEYSDEGHACWDRAYGAPETISWMLAQRRSRRR